MQILRKPTPNRADVCGEVVNESLHEVNFNYKHVYLGPCQTYVKEAFYGI